MNFENITRYRIELDVIERNPALGTRPALHLLRSEFALAVNAAYFMGLSGEEIDVHVGSRSIPQEGVARYTVVLELTERAPRMSDEQVAELLQREFQRAQNASHFRRIASEDFSVALVARTPAVAPAALRAA